MRSKWITIPVFLAGLLTLATVDSQGQPPPGNFGDRGGFGGSRGGFGGGRGGFDPASMWDRMAQGQDSINLNDPRFSFMKRMMEKRGEPLPPNGVLTKQQFVAGAQQRMAQRGSEGNNGGPGRFTPPGGSPNVMTFQATPGPDGKPVVTMQGPPGMNGSPDAMAQNFFRMSDRNGDGKITQDEASRGLRDRFSQYDTNRDGAIDANEFRPYIQERMGNRGDRGPGGSFDPRNGSQSSQYPNNNWGNWNNQGSNQNNIRDGRDRNGKAAEDERPSVVRYGNLPKGLPSWWDELDSDQDGQVGLYEWRRHGRATAEFVELDLNADGYLTADEWLRHEQLAIERRANDPDSAGSVGFGGGATNGRTGGGNMRFQFQPGGSKTGGDQTRGPQSGNERVGKNGKNRKRDNEDRPRKERKNPFTGN